MKSSQRTDGVRARRAKCVVGLLACALGVASAYPFFAEQREQSQANARLARVASRASELNREGDDAAERRDTARSALSLRRERLDTLLSTWEAIGGCGAGSSAGAGASVKWIGRSVRGGLFSAQLMASYLQLPKQYNVSGGYTLSLVAQATRDLGEKWNFGVAVPYLYKYYRDYLTLPLDVSNAGLGDVSLLLTRRFGAINDTILTATVGMPTATHDATFRNDLLTQDKQLGHGRVTGSLMLDHVFDEIWGLIVVGGLASYRGGTNEFRSYRAPMGSIYGHGAYYLGPFVPALGLTFNAFTGHDKDRTLETDSPLYTVAGSATVEWSNDYVALLVGGSFPFRLGRKKQGTGGAAIDNSAVISPEPWVVSVGVAVSPF